MGEYAKFLGQEVKIGTCESMYYLRADQAHRVSRLPGNVDPVKDAPAIRFRFPFPDEDHVDPGAFDPYNRSVRVNFPEGVNGEDRPIPINFDHDTIQFRHDAGFLVSIPCPDSADGSAWAKTAGVKVARNGYRGGLGISQQKLVDGKLVLIVECIACGALARLEEIAEVKPIVAVLVQSAERAEWHATLEANRIEASGHAVNKAEHIAQAGAFEREVARRILAGYTEPNYWTPK